jgi:hypothetical protein
MPEVHPTGRILMEQQASSLAATLLRHARRALLLVGAVFVWWLVFLAGGAAHADGAGAAGSTDQVGPAAQVVGVVDADAAATTASLRTTPPHVTHTLTAVTGHAPAPVAPTAQKLVTELEPSLSFTTDKVGDAVDVTVARTDAVVTPTLAPVLAPTGRSTTSSPVSPAPRAHRLQRSVPTPAVQRPVNLPRASESIASTADRAPVDPQGGGPVSGFPGGPGAPGMPGGSSAGGAGSAASLAGLFVMLPGVRRMRGAPDAARVLGGPAFPPGSSPD